MHMSDALVSTAVGTALWVGSGAVVYKSSQKIKDTMESHKVALMGVMGAFIFAGQMINFSIPGTGSSGHIGGGILLTALLGPSAAFITLGAVLLIQALFFGDGGILAYGCNLFNMGFFTCYVAYPLIFKPLLSKGISRKRLFLASAVAVVAGLQLGAFSVVLETLLSGKTELPFATFVMLMQPIHLAIGLVEGLVTGAILVFLWQARPEIIDLARPAQGSNPKGMKKILVTLLAASFIIGGGASLLASGNPDGLEWAMIKTAGTAELESDSPVHGFLGKVQEKTAILPDYGFKNSQEGSNPMGTSFSGLVGAGVTMIIVLGLGFAGRRRKHNA